MQITQFDVDQQRQTARQAALGQIQGGFDSMAKNAQTKRQEALALQDHALKLRGMGYDVTPDKLAKSLEEEPSGLAKFFGAKSPEKIDIYEDRTPEWINEHHEKRKERERANEKHGLEMEVLRQKAKGGGKTYKEQLQIEKLEKDLAGGGIAMTKGQEAADKDYGKQYNSFSSKGIVNTEATLNKLRAIAKELEDDQGIGEASGGSFVGGALFPDFLRSNDSIRRRDDARNAANSTLKELFPGALSDAERVAASQEYYNDKLGAKENAEILRGKISQLEAVRENEIRKAKYFEGKGSLVGFQMNEAPSGAYKKEIANYQMQPLDYRGENPQIAYSPTKVPSVSPIQNANASRPIQVKPQHAQKAKQMSDQELMNYLGIK